MTPVGDCFQDAAGNLVGFSGTHTGPATNGTPHDGRITMANQRVAL